MNGYGCLLLYYSITVYCVRWIMAIEFGNSITLLIKSIAVIAIKRIKGMC